MLGGFLNDEETAGGPRTSNENAVVGADADALHQRQAALFPTVDLAADMADRCSGSAASPDVWDAFEFAAAAHPFRMALPAQLPMGLAGMAKARCRCMAVRYDPTGRLLALGHQHPGAAIVTAENFGRPLQVVAHDTAGDLGWSLLDIAWHESGTYLVRCGWSAAIAVTRARDDSLTGRWRSHVFDARRLSDTPIGIFSVAMMGDTVVAATNVGMVFAADLETQMVRLRSHSHALDVNAVCAISPSGVFASGGDDGVIHVTDCRAKQAPVASCFGHTHGITSLDCRGDERYLVSNSKDQMLKIFDLRNATTDAAEVRIGMHQTHRSLNAIDYRAGPQASVRYVNTRADNSALTLKGHQVYFTLLRARFSPYGSTGGRFVACGSIDGRIPIFDVLTQELTFLVDQHYSEIVRDIAWHPSGAYLAAACVDGRTRVFGPNQSDVAAEAKIYASAVFVPRPTDEDEADEDDEDDGENDDDDGGLHEALGDDDEDDDDDDDDGSW